MKLFVTARNKRGAPIITLIVDDTDSLDTVLNAISDQLTQNPSRRVFLDKWIEGNRMISFRKEV